jgi:hypothetical protein
MAPNLRQMILLSEDASLADVSALVRDKVMTASTSSIIATVNVSPSFDASYWDWPADVPTISTDCFSAEHLEENLVQDPKTYGSVASSSPSLVAAHDDYWDESSTSFPTEASELAVIKALHTQISVEDDHAYWTMPTPGSCSSILRNNAKYAVEYCDETYYCVPTISERYWYNDGGVANREASSSASYWDERSSSTLTASDRYWSMAVL